MLQDFRADDQVKAVAFKGKMSGIHAGKIYALAGEIAYGLVKVQLFPGFRQVVSHEIRTHAAGILLPAGLNGMPALTAADIQNPVPRLNIDPVKINGKHG
jgi:hypothetical protein